MKIMCISDFVDYQAQFIKTLIKNYPETTVKTFFLTTNITSENQAILRGMDYSMLAPGKRLYNPSSIFSIVNLVKTIRRFDPDIIHIQLGGDRSNILLLPILPFIKKYPLVITFHDVETHLGEETFWTSYTNNLLRKSADKILVHGNYLKNEVVNKYHIPENQVHVINFCEHNVEPFKLYEKNTVKEDGNLILFFGRIKDYKGLDYLVKAQPLISKVLPNVKIVIAGRGNVEKYFSDTAEKDKFIVHNEHIPYDEGAELFQKSSIVVLPYIEASQSGVVITAYGFHKPVVVTSVGSIPEIVDDGKTGLVVPPRDPEALANAIVKLMRDEPLRKAMGENGYRKLKTELSWDNTVGDIMEIYKSALAGG